MFKQHYLMNTMIQAIRATIKEDGITLVEFLKNYVLNVINNISDSWDKVKHLTISSFRENLYPEVSNFNGNNFESLPDNLGTITNE